MTAIARISLDTVKLDALKQKLAAIATTVDDSAPQINKNRRIKSLLELAERDIAEMVAVKYEEEVPNG
jgi:hypothetical protein